MTLFCCNTRSRLALARLLALALAHAVFEPIIAYAEEPKLPTEVADVLDSAGVPHSAVGIYVYDLKQDKVVVDVAGDNLFNPASVMKLITTFAALDMLGPAYTWKTDVLIDGPIVDGHLDGNLYFKGHGDPKLSLEQFWMLLRELRTRGLNNIGGNVYLDRSTFAIDRHDPGEFDSEPTRPYNVGADALLLNYKTFLLRFVPDEAAGKVAILAEPQLAGVNIINNLALGKRHCNDWPRTPTHSGTTLAFIGVFPLGCGEKARYYSLLEPDAYFAAVFGQLWTELGGTLAGTVQPGNVPIEASFLATHESASLAEVVRETNKFSNNVMARHLFLSLGIDQGYPLTNDKAQRALTKWLERHRLYFSGLEVDNGSGLSRKSRLSPRQLGEVLVAAWRSPLMPEFVASLPLVAVDGTMRQRLDDSPVAGHAHVKTGYLDDVRAVAGYIKDQRGRDLAVVFFMNHERSRFASVAPDKFIEWVYAGVQD